MAIGIPALRRIDRSGQIALALCLAGLLSACAQTESFVRDETYQRPAGTARVLIMEPDVQVSQLTAGGLLEPNAQWTEQAKTSIRKALASELAESDAEMVLYEAPEFERADDPQVQVVKMHEAVAKSILLHKYTGIYQLPTEDGKLDWSLGPGTQSLLQDYDADYGLFVYLRDSFSSGGRTALIVIGALLQVPVQGGQQFGFASLVDLRSGEVLWFNRLIRNAGDVRDVDGAETAIDSLLEDLPL